jgi:hypothetical protein
MADDALPVGTAAEATEQDAVSMFEDYLAPKDTEESPEPEAAEEADVAPEEEDAAEDAAEPAAEEATEEDEATEPEAPAPVVTLDDGTALTADEVKKSYLRQADYTRKTQAVAELRKETEAEKAKASEERSIYAERLTQLEALLQQNAPSTEGLDVLRQTDPAEYAARVADLNRQQQQLASVQQERQRVLQQQSEEAAKQHSQYLAAERDRLLEAVPEWNADRAKAQEELQALRSAGLEYGFSDQELDQVADHRAILLLRDAMRYRQGLKATAKVQPKIARAPVLKPGTTGRVAAKPAAKKRQSDFERLKRTGRAEDAARLFEDLLDTE